ncbi:MAG: Lrp/AsnC family transcriptional regulator [Lachnospiraceae bacterium]|nr:Lrp/AsnC family transcriptional regulator [Lachnospiraceae bacterium]
MKNEQPDAIDEKILKLLMEDGRMSVRDIAEKVFLSSPAVASRLKKLEEKGIIKGYQPIINYSEFGYNIKAFINLEVSPEDKQDFYPFIKQIPNVIECSCVTGDYSMLIEVIFRYTEELDHLVNELQRFGRTKTLIAFSTAVEHRDIPLLRDTGAEITPLKKVK